MIDHARALALIGPFEGRVEHMYLDTVGAVTAGIGNMFPTAQAALSLVWRLRDGSGEGSPTEIADDFRRVSEAVPGMSAGRYKAITKLDLLDSEIDRLFGRRVDEFVKNLTVHFPAFPAFPDSAQLAILDMAFNLGAGAIPRKWPTLSGFIRSQDWLGCARHCHRPQSRDVRNDAVQELFMRAHEGTGSTPAAAIADSTTAPLKVG